MIKKTSETMVGRQAPKGEYPSFYMSAIIFCW